MKIIGISNFENVTVNDVLVCTGISETGFFGRCIVDFLNTSRGEDATYYYLLVPDDRVLYTFCG